MRFPAPEVPGRILGASGPVLVVEVYADQHWPRRSSKQRVSRIEKRSLVSVKEQPESSQQPAWFNYTNSEEFMERVRGGMAPLIICVACNGGIQGKEANEVIPETDEEIAESVGAAYDAGAAMVHIHARDPEDLTRGARNAEPWREVLRKVRERCPGIIINATTGGGPNMTMEERASSLEAGPEVASLNLAPDMSRFRLKERLSP